MYDIIIIGAGSGGLNIAGFMNKAGFRVLLIDKSDNKIGGDCLNTGCVPSKALLHIAKLIHQANKAGVFGVKTKGKVDFSKVSNYITAKQNEFKKHENAVYFRSIGMDVVLGTARFIGSKTIIVNGKQYTAKKIIIATGSRPRRLPADGITNVKYLTNENIFDLKSLPSKLVVIGAGPIGIEMAQAFNRIGCEVIVIEHGGKLLPKEDAEISNLLLEILQKEGIQFYFNATVKKIIKSKIYLDCGNKDFELDFDEILVSIGRVLNIEDLDLDNAGIEIEEGKIKLDKYLRTTNKNVYVCGDAAGAYMFTHAAELHAQVIIGNFFNPFKKKLSYENFSWVTFTDPEIATFGLNEFDIRNKEIKYDKLVLDLGEDDRTIIESGRGKAILYTSKNTILGGTIIGNNAGEIIQELILAKMNGLKLNDIFKKIYAYPTASRINKKIIANKLSQKLTPFNKKLLRFLY